MDRPEKKHPRHIRLHRQEEGGAPESRGLDFGRHVHLRGGGRPTQLIVILALVVVLGALVASTVLRYGGQDTEEAPVPAGAAFGPLSPSGEAARGGVNFVWAPHPRARGYELLLEDGEGRTVWAARVEVVTRIALPADLRAHLEPGRPYLWRVTALLPGGETEESPALAFVVR